MLTVGNIVNQYLEISSPFLSIDVASEFYPVFTLKGKKQSNVVRL